MTNKEMVMDVLEQFGAMTSRQIAVQVNLHHNVVLTPAQVAGALRPLAQTDRIASSKDERNQMRYWVVKQV